MEKKYIFWIIFILVVSFLAYCFFPVINFEEKNSPKRILLFDRNWIKITDKSNEFWYKINLEKNEIEKIKNSLFVKSLLKIEDKNFYNNFWVDILAKLRALKDNLSWKRISWASTITEQFIKNKYFLWQKRTYLQKAREAVLAIYFNFKYSKNKILENYLNNIFVWNNLYWIKTWAKVYFDKNIEDLNKEEITILLSKINYPSSKSILEKSFLEYQNKIIKRLWFSFKNKIKKLKKFKSLDEFPFVTNNYPILEFLPLSLREGGTKISIDSKLQEFTRETIQNSLRELKWKNVTNAAVFAFIPKEPPNPLIRGNYREWEVLVYQGSKDFYAIDIDGQVDVIKSNRQMGSSVKPFLYLMALENWYWTENLLIDLENEYNSFKNSKKYITENYSLKEYGLIRLKKALWNSLNNATVRLAKELWLENVYDFYKKYWFKLDKNPEFYGYSLVLWNPSIKLEDLVKSYSKLLDLKDKNKFLLYKILSNPDNRDISFWVNSILSTSIPMAVKTGTSSDFRDNVVISYHPDLIIWVWVWNNDNSSMKWVTWITWAWDIWHKITEKAIQMWYIKDREIPVPKWIIESKYCLDKDCFRKELIYKKKWKKYFSRLADNYYSKKDILEKISEYEKEKLGNLGFEIK